MKLPGAVLVLTAAASLCVALPPALPERGFSFAVSAGLDQYRDELLVPLRWDCGRLEPVVGFGAGSGPVRHEAQAAFLFEFGANRYSHEAAVLGVRAEYRLSCARGFALAQGRVRPGVLVFYRNRHAYLYSWDDSHLYWMNGTGVGLAAQWRGRVAGRMDVVADLAVPLFTMAARPDADRVEKVEPLDRLGFYFARTWQGMKPCLPDRYTAVEAAVGLEWRSRNSMMAAGYALDLLRTSWPAQGVSLAHGLWLRWSPGAAR
ncbi:MAG: hypothetical protein JSU73_11755 [candidate division WOR-3 bacterium]|nr:MAG: hypothetical protein JSU73_11755 [candidate division WOR-3 bacterium]